MPRVPPVISRSKVLGSGTGDGVVPVPPPFVPPPFVPVPVVPVPVVPVAVVPVFVTGRDGAPGMNGVNGAVGSDVAVVTGVAGVTAGTGVAGVNTGTSPKSARGDASGNDGTISVSRLVGMNSAGNASSGKSSPQIILKRYSISAGVSLGAYLLWVGTPVRTSLGWGATRWRAARTTWRLANDERFASAFWYSRIQREQSGFAASVVTLPALTASSKQDVARARNRMINLKGETNRQRVNPTVPVLSICRNWACV